MKELLTELRNKVLYLRNTEELSAKGELILLHKLNALEKQFAISDVVSTLKCDCGNTEDVKNIPICASCYNPHTGEW